MAGCEAPAIQTVPHQREGLLCVLRKPSSICCKLQRGYDSKYCDRYIRDIQIAFAIISTPELRQCKCRYRRQRQPLTVFAACYPLFEKSARETPFPDRCSRLQVQDGNTTTEVLPLELACRPERDFIQRYVKKQEDICPQNPVTHWRPSTGPGGSGRITCLQMVIHYHVWQEGA